MNCEDKVPFDSDNPAHKKEDLKFFLRKNDTTIFIPSGAKVPKLCQIAHQQMLASKSLLISSSYHFCCQLSFAKATK
jgi:hypothetical protein